MTKQKINRSQQTADHIYHMIFSDKAFSPGEQLPSENILSKQLGVSRTTLREAIRTLESNGILNVIRGKGTYVAEQLEEPEDFGLTELKKNHLRLRDLWEARLLFEPDIAAVACKRATEMEMQTILNLGKRTEQAIRAGEDRAVPDQAFHRAIAVATHNEFMMQVFPLINSALEESVRWFQNSQALTEYTIADHAMLMDFFEKRDPRGAKNAMAIHIRHAIQVMDLYLPQDIL